MSASALQALATQRDDARAVGNAIRMNHAAIKRELRSGALKISEAFEDERAAKMRVCDLLEAVPYMSPRRVSSILLAAQVGYARPVGHIRAGEYWRLSTLIRQRHPVIRGRL